jgi:folate-dependent phosphoribosylglycinamide formyltransferase PurN
MVQSTGIKKIKCAVFISGTGSNLKSLIQFSKKKNSPISIELIISDNKKAKGLKFGKNFKILNIHPSLLPKYKGLNTHQRAISNNEKYSGCTVHFVNSRLDSGKIILQKKVKISKFDTAKSLSKKILIQEHKLYPKAIRKVFNL